MDELWKSIEEMKKRMSMVKKTLQPLPAVVCDKRTNFTSAYVVIDDKLLLMESPLVAFDTCFKILQALHLCYPVQSLYSWLFVQQALYGIQTEWDSLIPAVESKVTSYKRIARKN